MRKDGKWIWIRSQAVLTERDGTLVAEGTFEDVTHRHSLEDQVRQSQKMEAIGRLTGGVAHDFNNILAIILGNGRFLLDELPESDPRRADALAMVEAGERAASLTRQLLMFSRRQIVKHERLDMNDIVRGLEKMLRRIIGEDIELSLNLTAGPAPVVADGGELEQVIMNLVVNARDAMPNGGQLTIETVPVVLDAPYAELHPDIAPSRYLMLSVSDSGCGMDADTKRRAFEPFFTTKGQGQGTGLGLATCYGIVRGCQGQISVYSEVGHGTIFKVYLPLAADAAYADREAMTVASDMTGNETILLIEDDDTLRRTIRRILAARGYNVLEATGSGDALAIAERHAGPIDLALSDMVMPGLSGPDTVTLVQQRRPSLKVLYMSGYSDHALLRLGPVNAVVNFIQKPFAPKALAARLREVMDGTTSGEDAAGPCCSP
jgi:signal transduction histidine kinase/CheY-like chemotaxis protein